MRRHASLCLLALCAIASAWQSAQSPSAGNEHAPQAAAPAATTFAAANSKILCDAGDKVVFSCPLVKGARIASMCAVSPASDGEPRFYYAFGRPGAAELRIPATATADNAVFSRTHLGFAGNTGGYAYAFANDGYKYIVYSVSGSGAMQEGGVGMGAPQLTTTQSVPSQQVAPSNSINFGQMTERPASLTPTPSSQLIHQACEYEHEIKLLVLAAGHICFNDRHGSRASCLS